jgi:hypothetical protein
LLAGAALVAAVTALAVPARAQTPDATGTTYKASAKATGLDLKVFGQGVTLGLSQTDVTSDPKANATGIGLVLPDGSNQTEITASSGAEGETTGTPAPGTCGQLTLPDDVPVIDLATACASGTTSIVDGLPASLSTAEVADLDVNAGDVLQQLPFQIKDITDQAQPLVDGLQPLFDGLEQGGFDAESLLSDLLTALNDSGELMHTKLGPTQAESKAVNGDQNTVLGNAKAQGAVIELLPRTALDLPPVATIEIGAAANSMTVDRATGAATVNFEPSLVKITLADDVVTALGPVGEPFASPVSIAPGQSQCIPLPPPLESCITVAGGSQSTLEDGTTHAEAAGVSLDLFKGLPEGGISLSLAKTVVEGVAVAPAPPAPAPPQEGLARTGGSTNAALIGGLLAVAVAGYLLTRSSRRRSDLEAR